MFWSERVKCLRRACTGWLFIWVVFYLSVPLGGVLSQLCLCVKRKEILRAEKEIAAACVLKERNLLLLDEIKE